MSTGRKLKSVAAVLLLCFGASVLTFADQAKAAPPAHSQRKQKKQAKTPLRPLPSGPTGPVQPIPLDSMSPVPPQVTFQNGQLTIVAPNSTLGDILRAVRKQTGAEIEIPSATERVVTHLGPGSARDVIADLLNGSRFNYVLLGSPADNSTLTRVVLVAKTGQEATANTPESQQMAAQPPQPGVMQHTGNPGAPLPDADASAPEPPEDSADDAADQAASEAEQPPPSSPDQPAVKTPQQMLQEMQQRQMQLQQQQQTGQPPVMPGPGTPQRPE